MDIVQVSFSRFDICGNVRLALHHMPMSPNEIAIGALLSLPYKNEEQLDAKLKELGLPVAIAKGDPEHTYSVCMNQLEGLGFLYL